MRELFSGSCAPCADDANATTQIYEADVEQPARGIVTNNQFA